MRLPGHGYDIRVGVHAKATKKRKSSLAKAIYQKDVNAETGTDKPSCAFSPSLLRGLLHS